MLDVNSCNNEEVLPEVEDDVIVDVVDLDEYYRDAEDDNMSCWDSISK